MPARYFAAMYHQLLSLKLVRHVVGQRWINGAEKSLHCKVIFGQLVMKLRAVSHFLRRVRTFDKGRSKQAYEVMCYFK